MNPGGMKQWGVTVAITVVKRRKAMTRATAMCAVTVRRNTSARTVGKKRCVCVICVNPAAITAR